MTSPIRLHHAFTLKGVWRFLGDFFYLRPAWLLQHRRPVLRIFLLLLLLIMGIGFAGGSLEGSLDGIAGGHTSLAYWLASQRNNASLKPLEMAPDYQLSANSDTTVQKYFALNPQTGDLLLRDGLTTINPLINPLQVFPLRIQRLHPEKSVGLYVRVVGCSEYLQLLKASSKNGIQQSADPQHDLSAPTEEQALQCAAKSTESEAFILRETNLAEIKRWLEREPIPGVAPQQKDSPGSPQAELRNLYQKDLQEVLPPETGGRSVNIYWIDVLDQDAMPGLRIFSFRSINTIDAKQPAPGVSHPLLAALHDGLARILIHIDRIVVALLRLRLPLLLGLGLLMPLVLYLRHLHHTAVRCALQPYLLLFLAQVFTMLIAMPLMGEGLVLWVGLIYTSLRVVQLLGMLGVGVPAVWTHFPSAKRFSTWLTPLLLLELALWSLNGFGLLWHIFSVFRRWDYISPA